VNVLYGGGMSADWCADPGAESHLATVKALLDDVNIEDKGLRRKRSIRACVSSLGTPGAAVAPGAARISNSPNILPAASRREAGFSPRTFPNTKGSPECRLKR
jgi:hypothetical protein